MLESLSSFTSSNCGKKLQSVPIPNCFALQVTSGPRLQNQSFLASIPASRLRPY